MALTLPSDSCFLNQSRIMSFIDLATLTLHRRNEMESRVQVFDEKCDRAIEDIKKLKAKARSFVPQLNCEPTELKERFLQFINKLEEYQYLVTDFNLAISQIDDLNNTDYTPVQDRKVLQPSSSPFNLIDALSETMPSSSCVCSHLCPPEKPKPMKVSKDEQVLIAFSASTSSESVQGKKVEQEGKSCWKKLDEPTVEEVVQEVEKLKVEEPQEPPQEPSEQAFDDATNKGLNLPPQQPLELGLVYKGVIMYVDGSHFYIITEDYEEAREFINEMNDFYFNNKKKLTAEEVLKMSYCAYYDPESDSYYRALCIKDNTLDGTKKMQVYAVDVGELQTVPIDVIQPLMPQFFQRPPYARPCFLAGVDLTNNNEDSELMKKQEAFLKTYLGVLCDIQVDDDTSESLGVYVVLPSNKTLNEEIIRAGLADPIDDKLSVAAAVVPKKIYGPPPERDDFESDPDIADLPEHEDPVEAVTGYHNRDEVDICKFYKGGPQRTCYKGSKCKKKHIMKHPDGWTLDRVEVLGKVKSVPLPAAGSYHTVRVTFVAHYDHVYVHLVDKRDIPEPPPEFGVVLPPKTLKSLVQDMNSAATRTAYQKLKLAPAPGELIAAVYPMDQYWYRARVLTVTPVDQSVEVMYIDYGTVLWIKADQIRALDSRFLLLPAQAVRCVLAGVYVKSQSPEQLSAAKQALSALVENLTLTAHVISREYDEITVDLIDQEGYSISQQLAATGLVDLKDYQSSAQRLSLLETGTAAKSSAKQRLSATS